MKEKLELFLWPGESAGGFDPALSVALYLVGAQERIWPGGLRNTLEFGMRETLTFFVSLDPLTFLCLDYISVL